MFAQKFMHKTGRSYAVCSQLIKADIVMIVPVWRVLQIFG